MAKRGGALTRERIIETAAGVFSERGYFGSSLEDLLQATGLKKGGLYNHFRSKEQLALASFDWAVGKIERRFEAALVGVDGTVDRLLAIVEVIRGLIGDEALPGGCPILTTAIEADDTMPTLLDKARAAMTRWQWLIGSNVKKGVARGELKADADPYAVATVITATLEGAVFLSKLYDNPQPMHHAVDHVVAYVRGLAA